jgi:hypothetical protein
MSGMKSAPIRITMPVKIIEAELISALKLDICLRDFKKIEDDFINELNFNKVDKVIDDVKVNNIKQTKQLVKKKPKNKPKIK